MPYASPGVRKQKRRERYNNKVLQGICTDCTLPAVNGTTLCEKHLLNHRLKSARRNPIDKAYFIANRRCSRCGTPLEDEEGKCCSNCSGRKSRKEMTYITCREYRKVYH